jgi:hypothetical protein
MNCARILVFGLMVYFTAHSWIFVVIRKGKEVPQVEEVPQDELGLSLTTLVSATRRPPGAGAKGCRRHGASATQR